MKSRFISLILLWLSIALKDGISQTPDSLDSKIDVLVSSVAENSASRSYFITLGPEVVPIVTKKLNESVAEGSSTEGARAGAIIDMPGADQKRVRFQVGLIAMQGAALQSISLDDEMKRAAQESLYGALQSPYEPVRYSAIHEAASGVGSEAVDRIVPLLDDLSKYNRVAAAQMLAKIGNASTAEKIAKVLEQRRQGLSAEQVEKDWSFRHGYKAIESLRNKATAVPVQAQPPASSSASPVAGVQQASPHEASHVKTSAIQPKSPASSPIVPVVIIAVVIVGVIAFLLRRKSP